MLFCRAENTRERVFTLTGRRTRLQALSHADRLHIFESFAKQKGKSTCQGDDSEQRDRKRRGLHPERKVKVGA